MKNAFLAVDYLLDKTADLVDEIQTEIHGPVESNHEKAQDQRILDPEEDNREKDQGVQFAPDLEIPDIDECLEMLKDLQERFENGYKAASITIEMQHKYMENRGGHHEREF